MDIVIQNQKERNIDSNDVFTRGSDGFCLDYYVGIPTWALYTHHSCLLDTEMSWGLTG